MPSSGASNKARKRTKTKTAKSPTSSSNTSSDADMATRSSRHAMTTSLEGTPVVPRFSHATEDDDVNIELLTEEDRVRAARGTGESLEELGGARSKRPLSTRDKRAMALLILLCELIGYDYMAY
jgi:hypothetical protein